MSSLETKSPKPPFWLSASKDQAKDTGLALVLVCCIVFLVTKDQRLILLATGLQLLNMGSRMSAWRLWIFLASFT